MDEISQSPNALPSNEDVTPSHLPFPVVGIGASAGGLQALLKFFETLPSDTGMAFVIILHLSPKHESSASAILQRATKMPVVEVTEPKPIQANHVYVISPNLQLEMIDGYLRVRKAERPVGQHVAIDLFFRTLADVHRNRAFGVILSGTGADGAIGLARLKEQGGVTLAQHPDDAEYGGMPSAAVATGIVDFVLPVVEMPQKLIDLWRNAQAIVLPATKDHVQISQAKPSIAQTEAAEEALRDVLNLLRSKTGHDFRDYKRATMLRRIERRLQVRQVPDLPSYREIMTADAGEAGALLNDMLIGVTQFFRDCEAFDTLEREIIPLLFEGKKENDQVRAWSAACSSGEEAYSLAILLHEHAQTLPAGPSFQVFASDIDEKSIAKARAGSYSEAIVTDVSPARLRECFSKEEGRYRVRKNIRDTVLFAAQNLLRDPPFSKLDFISCRNLLIYLNRDKHAQLLEMFHFALNPNGYLFLGSSESADALPDFFVPVDKKHRLYRARPVARSARTTFSFPIGGHVMTTIGVSNRETERPKFSFSDVYQRGLAHCAPPSILVNHQSEILFLSDGANEFLRHVSGEPSRNIITLIEPELRLELRTALFQAIQSGKSVETQRIKLEEEGKGVFVSMTARPFDDEQAGSSFVMILFHKTQQITSEPVYGPRGEKQDAVLAGLEEDLHRTKLQLQDTIEHSEASTEELKASYEELQAINEELRSATEELETSKEELQSVNEELLTVNAELKRKVDETAKTNDDLQNLIVSTDIATVFVDRDMRIKRFTPRAADIFNILPGDVGRSLHDCQTQIQMSGSKPNRNVRFLIWFFRC
jgi:two-component system CheB/CheR fusion protein